MDVSIISINYNNSNLFKNFLNSLKLNFPSGFTYEVIIIDNASQEEDFTNLKAIISSIEMNIILHKSNLNLGFGGGNMLGNQFAKGNYLAFINSDIIFFEDCFSPLIQFLKQNKKAGVCTPQQYNENKQPKSGLDYFYGIRKELFGRFLIELSLPKDQLKRKEFPYSKNSKADFIQGCFLFFDASKFNIVGGFDTNIFLYFEEMDISYRLLQKGYNSFIVPSTSFIHLHGASTKPSLLIKQEILISKLYIYRKNYTYFKYKILQSILGVKWFFKSLLKLSYFKLFLIIILGAPLKFSLKQKQFIIFNQ